MLVRFSTATHLHSDRKRVEGKTLSNQAFASSRSDSCSAFRESVSESGERSFQGCAEKTPHSQVVQEAEFALVGIGIALLRSRAESGIRAEPLRRLYRSWPRNRVSPQTPLSAVSSGLVFLACRERATSAGCFSPTSERAPVRASERSGLHFALATCRMHYAYL